VPERRDTVLQIILDEIKAYPEVYSKKTPAEVSILLSRDIPTGTYDTVSPDKSAIITTNATEADLDKFMGNLVTDGKVDVADTQDKQVEILVKRYDQLGIGYVDQGEVEATLIYDKEHGSTGDTGDLGDKG